MFSEGSKKKIKWKRQRVTPLDIQGGGLCVCVEEWYVLEVSLTNVPE